MHDVKWNAVNATRKIFKVRPARVASVFKSAWKLPVGLSAPQGRSSTFFTGLIFLIFLESRRYAGTVRRKLQSSIGELSTGCSGYAIGREERKEERLLLLLRFPLPPSSPSLPPPPTARPRPLPSPPPFTTATATTTAAAAAAAVTPLPPLACHPLLPTAVLYFHLMLHVLLPSSFGLPNYTSFPSSSSRTLSIL
ncbi:hypothetical protein ALC60_03108 [Trachymyrmex zeteki]|uniref:Uncharacterized protein n=1 Tax=Mycetomoellerius zeteki TaxID=64791 RepID=A0A151XCD4_9HYME|nr:hypothetical protein ALC60_03108 [Trachymyrmex zeteki]